MAKSAKVWRDEHGNLFHDACFEEGESREGYVEVDVDEVDGDETCKSCGGNFYENEADEVEDEEEEGREEQETA